MIRSRDVWPVDNPLGDYHTEGTECACCPWSYRDADGAIVVVHVWFTERVILCRAEVDYYTPPPLFDEAKLMAGVEWKMR